MSGDHCLQAIVHHWADRFTVHRLQLDDPRQLPLAAAAWLRQHEEPADLHLHFEDDLVIQDPRYVDKLVFFAERTEHRSVLIPHRFEPCVAQAPMRLYGDGPVKPVDQQEPVWADQEQELARAAEPMEFVGPLETAATGTVLGQFPVLKLVWAERDFLCLEHGHPSVLLHLERLPLQASEVAP